MIGGKTPIYFSEA